MEQKPKQPGGRPRKPEGAKLVQRSIRMLPEDWAKVDAYGLQWLRDLIRRAKGPKG